MGTDIHCWVEKRAAGAWHLVPMRPGDALFMESGDALSMEWCTRYERNELRRIDFDRNYDAFAILADVRNGSGFAGVVTGDGFEPILGRENPRRGWPEDISADLRDEEPDHSASWLTLTELEGYNWDRSTRKCGVISLEEYAAWRAAGGTEPPENYSGSVFGRDICTVEAREADEILTRDGVLGPMGERIYVCVDWHAPYATKTGGKYIKDILIPELVKIAAREGVSHDDLRIVFYFDS